MSFIWITKSLSYDGEGTVNRTGHNGGYDCSPAGILGCLPRCLCLPWAIDGMMQLLTKINGPYSDMLLRKTMYSGGISRGRIFARFDGNFFVGSSVGHADWPHMLGAVDNPPGGVWIDFIRHTLEDSQSIVAVPVTGSLVSPTSFCRRDANCTGRSSIFCIVCGTDWVLPAVYQVLLPEYVDCGTMDADGFSIVDNRAGVTFGVELYVSWDAPEMAVDLSCLYCTSTKCSGCFRDEWSSRQRVTFCKGGTPVVFECLFRTAEVWTRTFMT